MKKRSISSPAHFYRSSNSFQCSGFRWGVGLELGALKSSSPWINCDGTVAGTCDARGAMEDGSVFGNWNSLSCLNSTSAFVTCQQVVTVSSFGAELCCVVCIYQTENLSFNLAVTCQGAPRYMQVNPSQNDSSRRFLGCSSLAIFELGDGEPNYLFNLKIVFMVNAVDDFCWDFFFLMQNLLDQLLSANSWLLHNPLTPRSYYLECQLSQ